VRLVDFWLSHGAELWALVARHTMLVLVSTLAAIAIGVPLGIAAAHRPRVGRPVVAVANIAQTIPSLALLGFLLPLPFIGGVGPRVAIVALILYALLPIVRGTVAGIRGIDAAVVDAGIAMGMTPRQLLTMVELPLALPTIVSGIRVATVVGVGTATVAAAIGAGGLGEYIFRGLSMVDSTVILAGAIPAAALAVGADALLTLVERQLQPSRGRRGRRALATLGLIAAAAIAVAAASGPARRDTIVVGSKNFTEQIILGELVAQSLERAGLTVDRKLNLGGTFICDQALRAGDIDVYVEYTGTAWTAIFRQPATRDRALVTAGVRDRYASAGVTMLPPLGFNNTFAILVRRKDAEARNLRTIGDLTQVPNWQPGFGYEFIEREDGYRGLSAAYGLRFAAQPRVMDLALMYRALASGDVDVIAGDATSALIQSLDLVVLADDRGYFPPYDAVPVVRTAAVLADPRVADAIGALAAGISEADMRAMNHAADVERRDVAAIARDYLRLRWPSR
jgi:osmoprotectant transport system permease protein